MSAYESPEEVRQRYLEAMGSELGSMFYVLWNECVGLHWKWCELMALFGRSEERVKLLNSSAPSFFKVVQDCMWEDVTLHIARLMDPPRSSGKQNLSLRCLPALVDDAVRPELTKLVNLAATRCAFARDWRMRRIAHRDLNLALDKDVAQLSPATQTTVKDALKAISSVLNCLESHYCNNGQVPYELFEPTGGADVLLRVLRDGLEARAAREQRLKSGQALPEDFAAFRPV
jgi:hypothetical protein